MKTTLTPTEHRRGKYDKAMKYVGSIEAILILVDNLESIDYDAMSEEEYKELITDPAALLFKAKKVLETYAKQYIKDVPT